LTDEQLIQQLLTTNDTINNTEDITLVTSIYSTDAVLYHGNRTHDTSDDFLFKNGISEIIDFYLWSFDNLDMDYMTIAQDIAITGNSASCTAYVSGTQIDTNTQQTLTLTNQLQLWQFEKINGIWLITEGTIICDWVESPDSITIVSVSPNSGLIDGVDYDFTVVVNYELVTKDQGELDIGFNNGPDIKKYSMLMEYQIVDTVPIWQGGWRKAQLFLSYLSCLTQCQRQRPRPLIYHKIREAESSDNAPRVVLE